MYLQFRNPKEFTFWIFVRKKSQRCRNQRAILSRAGRPTVALFVALHSGDEHLYLFEFDSGKWRSLADVPVSYPNWSHDGKYVYFRPTTADSRAILRVAVANGRVEKVANLTGVERSPFFMGDWIGLATDNSPLAIRNSTIEDIYAWDLIAR